ncbi:MAG: sugar transferase [Calditrichaceae bacterium]|nr:sugar transferase [Calditrichaceae bacterium]
MQNKYRYKRLVDLLLLLAAIILGLPLILLISIILFFIQGRNIFFCQIRPGYHEIPFKLIKFRTMKNLYDNDRHLLPDEQRLTNFGLLLRRTSLDELPSLINILRGEMSFVGPRPLLVEYLPLYSKEQARRHEVMPGITGWAQVKGRNNISWEKKFEFDIWYVDNLSFWLDIKILFLTIVKVFKREGINQPGHATMEIFNPITIEKNDKAN